MSGACYQLQAARNGDTSIGCMCTGNNCNARQPYLFVSSPGVVECQLAYNRLTDDVVETETCRGDYCLVQRLLDGAKNVRFIKGCLTVSTPDAIKTGYRNILGVEQWICDQPLCNKDVDAATKSFNLLQQNNAVMLHRCRFIHYSITTIAAFMYKYMV